MARNVTFRGMHGHLAHFAFNADDVAERAAASTRRLFGWTLREPVPGVLPYVKWPVRRSGWCRGRRALLDAPTNGPECTFAVEDLNAALKTRHCRRRFRVDGLGTPRRWRRRARLRRRSEWQCPRADALRLRSGVRSEWSGVQRAQDGAKTISSTRVKARSALSRSGVSHAVWRQGSSTTPSFAAGTPARASSRWSEFPSPAGSRTQRTPSPTSRMRCSTVLARARRRRVQSEGGSRGRPRRAIARA